MAKRKTRYKWLIPITILVILIGTSYYYIQSFIRIPKASIAGIESGPKTVLNNYGDEILLHSKVFQIPPEYAAALCMLECGGRKPAPSRYEKNVFTKLKWVKLGVRSNYEHVTQSMLADADDEALQNLATSWGPFQLMGYKCLLYGIKVKDLRGDNGVYWAMQWIRNAYGSYLDSQDFKSAFHIHNAGTPFPKSGITKTYHAHYVPQGLQWMAYYENKFK